MHDYRFTSSAIILILNIALLHVLSNLAQSASVHVRVINKQELEIRLDLSTQILFLDIPVDKKMIDNHWDMASQRWIQNKKEGTEEATLYPTIKNILGSQRSPDFLSASIFIAKAKQFDDGLMAAVEYLCQFGGGTFIGKQWLLQEVAYAVGEILEGVKKENNRDGVIRIWQKIRENIGELYIHNGGSLNYCQSFIHAAASLGGQEITSPYLVREEARNIKAIFLKNPLKSKPIGFYTWTDELSQIFLQDRLLQTVFDPKNESEKEVIASLGRGLTNDDSVWIFYNKYLSFVQKLTNPFPPEYYDLTQIYPIEVDKKYCFFPPSQAHETQFVKKLYGNRSIPEGFSLIDALVEKIQEGEIDLTPKEDSGWYDHQVYALEPFVKFESMPEAKKIYISNKYKKELLDLFKASIALTRETHVKQLEFPLFSMILPPPTIDIYPEISIEPIASYYLRRAESYRFIIDLLDSTFGYNALRDTYRLTPSGKVSKPLLVELNEMESLFYGAYQIVAEEIGMVESDLEGRSAEQRKADKQFTMEWISQIADDKDVGTDNRMMVPVFYDVERKKVKVCVVMGYAAKPLSVSFKQPPRVEVVDANGKKIEANLKFESIEKKLIYPVSAEIYVDELLNRNEFRELCDKYKSQSAILASLSN